MYTDPNAEVGSLFEHFHPGAQVPAWFKQLIDAAYEPPSWELAMAQGCAPDGGEMHGAALEMLLAVVARMDAAIAADHGHLDWTVIAHDLVKAWSPRPAREPLR